MPSVRIRRSQYSTLGDRVHHEQPSRTRRGSVFNIWPQSAATADPSTAAGPPEQQQSGPHRAPPIVVDNARQTLPDAVSPRQRQRAGSRVFDHCMRRSQRHRGSHSPDAQAAGRRSGSSERPLSQSPEPLHQGFITIEGPTADILVHSTGPSLVGSALSLPEAHSGRPIPVDVVGNETHHHDDIVEHLDVIDPQVATVSNLTNAANSILIPPLSWYSRKPVVILSSPPPSASGDDPERASHYEDDLDRHVDDVLRRRAKVKRTLKGIWSFLKTPMGIITGIYGFLVVFWGAAIVIFLARIINLHDEDLQGFWVEVSSQVTNGLFTVTGVGLIPSRVLDTYRICKIWYYKRRTKKLRKKAGLPQLFDVDDLPDPMYDPNYVHVLTEEEQNDLHRQQVKFQYHQTWYRAHGTETHRAFPINMALMICLFNDGNSIFQIILCGTMWGMNRFIRPAWSTGTLIPASFLCGIASAICIAWGGNKTKRTEKVEERLRAALAMDLPEQDEKNVEKDVEPGLKNTSKSNRTDGQSGDGHQNDGSLPPTDPEKHSYSDDDEIVVDEHMSVPAVEKVKGTTNVS